MTAVLLDQPPTVWWCPRCPRRVRKPSKVNDIEFHHCPAVAGALVPMEVDDGKEQVRTTLVVTEREDYTGRDKPQLNAEGRPIQRIEVLDRATGAQKHLVIFCPSGQAGRLSMEVVEEWLPRQVKRKGEATMRQYVSRALMRRFRR